MPNRMLYYSILIMHGIIPAPLHPYRACACNMLRVAIAITLCYLEPCQGI